MEDPIRHYYNKILGIYYSDKSIDLVESEFFDLGHLEKWAIKNSILQGELKQELDEQVMYDRLKVNGQFPLKNLGERIKQSISVEAHKVVEKVKTNLSIGNPSSLIIRIELNENYVIEGSADSIFGDKFLFATVSGDKWKYQVRAVIQFLAVIIASEERINKGIYVSKDKTKELVGNADNAKAILKKLCIYYEEGTLNLKHFSVEFGGSLSSLFEEDKTIEAFIKSLYNIIDDSYSHANPSEYFMRELNNGSMSNQNAMDTFRNHFQLLRELLTTSII
jgi:exodeoxyribonuclease V gamma subunit